MIAGGGNSEMGTNNHSSDEGRGFENILISLAVLAIIMGLSMMGGTW
jgi:hypothetical protein